MLPQAASRKPQAASRKPQAASRKPQAASRKPAGPSRPDFRTGRRRARLSLLVPALALLLGALSLFAAAPAQAQTTVWSATLTVDEDDGFFGCDNATATIDNCSSSSVLTDDDFTYGGKTYAVRNFYWDSSTNHVNFGLDVDGMAATTVAALSSLRLNVDGAAFATTTQFFATGVLAWPHDPATDWTDGQQLSVSLTAPAAPANAHPSVTLSTSSTTFAGRFGPTVTLNLSHAPPKTGAVVIKATFTGSLNSDDFFGLPTKFHYRAGEGHPTPKTFSLRLKDAAVKAGRNGTVTLSASYSGDIYPSSVTITVNAPTSDATLSGLTATGAPSLDGTYSALTLSPTFSATTTDYTATAASTVTHVKVTPTTTTSSPNVKVYVRRLPPGCVLDSDPCGWLDVPSGSASGSIELASGATLSEIKVEVLAQDLSKQNYWVAITRPGQSGTVGFQRAGPDGSRREGEEGGTIPERQSSGPTLISRMYEWRNDPQWSGYKSHTDRWDRALLALGETVPDGSLEPMTAAEAQAFADSGMTRWVDVAQALRAKEAREGGTPDPQEIGEPVQDLRLVPPAPYDDLIAEIYGWRNEQPHASHKSHTDRLDRVLLAFGEPVSDTSLTPMTAAAAQQWADEGWDPWIRMVAALREIVTGTSGSDTLEGTGSGELIVGLGGADTLSGKGGPDELRGGSGDDDLSGGEGADRFVFFSGEAGAKAITDFAAGDVIVLKRSGWDSVADIIASVQAIGSGDYRYTLAPGLTVETTNNRSLRTEDLVTE